MQLESRGQLLLDIPDISNVHKVFIEVHISYIYFVFWINAIINR